MDGDMKYTTRMQGLCLGFSLMLFVMALINESFFHALHGYDGLAALATGSILSVTLFTAPAFKEMMSRGTKRSD